MASRFKYRVKLTGLKDIAPESTKVTYLDFRDSVQYGTKEVWVARSHLSIFRSFIRGCKSHKIVATYKNFIMPAISAEPFGVLIGCEFRFTCSLDAAQFKLMFI